MKNFQWNIFLTKIKNHQDANIAGKICFYHKQEKCHAINYFGLLFSPLLASLRAEMDYKECRHGCEFYNIFYFIKFHCPSTCAQIKKLLLIIRNYVRNAL